MIEPYVNGRILFWNEESTFASLLTHAPVMLLVLI